MSSVPFDVAQALERHGRALRHLAGELVLDPNAADDAVQNVWLAALQRPPQHQRALGAWLAAALRNVVKAWRRKERRREGHEVGAAEQRGDVDRGDAVVREQLARTLLAAVETLGPPYRDAIWSRFFEGKSPRAIAAASGVPVATVKSRLQRGLGNLRVMLGEGEGDGERGDWRRAFAVAFGLEKGTAAASAVAAGGVVMATWMKLTGVIAAAAVVLAALMWWPRPDDIAIDVRTNGEAARPVAANVGDPGAGPAREVAASAEASLAAAEPVPGLARCRGRLVDAATKLPLAGATVTLRNSIAAQPEANDPVCVTRDDGAFAFSFPSERWLRLWFRADAHLAASIEVSPLSSGQDDDVGDVELIAGRRLCGRIVDEQGVALPAGTVLHAMFPPPTIGMVSLGAGADATIGSDGAFRCEPAVALGPVDFELNLCAYELQERVVVTASEPVELTLTAHLRPRIDGIVVDERDVPLADVHVVAGLSGIVATTSARGTFTLMPANPARSATIEVRVLHAPDFLVSHTKDVPWGTKDLRIVLQHANPVPIEVVDDAGAPVEQFGVVLMREGTEEIERGTVLQRGVHAEGRLGIEGVDPGRTSLRVVPVDDHLSPSAFVPIATNELQRFVLARRVPCTVAVTRGGRPVKGARVEIVFVGPAGVATEPLPKLIDPHRGGRAWVSSGTPECVAAASTDANGVASLLRDVEVAGRVIQVHVAGRPPYVVREPAFPARIELPSIGTIAGRVQLRGRYRTEGAIAATRNTGAVAGGGAADMYFAAQPDGTFRSPPLSAGSWRVALRGREASARDVDVRDGETTVVDFDFADYPLGVVRGRLLREGALPEGLTAELLRLRDGVRPAPTGRAPVGRDGTFVIGELQPGTYRLALRSSGASTVAMPAMFADTYVIGAGESLQIDVPLPPRRLVVHLHGGDGLPVRGTNVVTRCGGAQWPSFGLFAAPVDGVMVLDPAPMLPVEFAAWRNAAPVWSAPIVMPPDRSEAEVTVVLPE